jgi:hypothetical protein
MEYFLQNKNLKSVHMDHFSKIVSKSYNLKGCYLDMPYIRKQLNMQILYEPSNSISHGGVLCIITVT